MKGEDTKPINSSESESKPLLSNNSEQGAAQQQGRKRSFYNNVLSWIGNVLSLPFEMVKCCFIWQDRKPHVSLELDGKCKGCNIVVAQAIDQENDCIGNDPLSRVVNGNSIVFKIGLNAVAYGLLFHDLIELSKSYSRAAVDSSFLQVTFWYSRSELIWNSQFSRALGGFGIPLILLGVDIPFRYLRLLRLSCFCFKLFDNFQKNTDFLLLPDNQNKYIFASFLGFISSYVTSATEDFFKSIFYNDGNDDELQKIKFLKSMAACINRENNGLIFNLMIIKDLHKIIYDLRDGQINRLSDDVKKQQYEKLREMAVNALQDLAIINPHRKHLLLKLLANYALWSNGYERNYWFDSLFYLSEIALFYGYYRTALSILQPVIEWALFVNEKSNCESQHYVYAYMPNSASYECSVCGDWKEVPYRDVSDSQKCIDSYLNRAQPAKNVITALQRTLPFGLSRVDLSKQTWWEWSDAEFKTVLALVKQNANVGHLRYLNLGAFFQMPGVLSENKTSILTQAFSNSSLTAESLVLSGMIISPNATAAIITAQGNNTFALDLSNMYLGYVETSVLAKSMNALINLRFLNMSRNMLDNAAVMVLEPMMHGMNLTSIDFSHNTFNSTGIESLAKRPFSDLKELYLSHLPLVGANLSAVGKIIESSPKLNKLVLKENKINDDNIITFVNSLPRSNLHELDLGNNDLDVDSGMYLGMNMQNSTVVKLSLSDNRLGDEGIAYFSRYLSNMRSLRQIAFSDNAIGDIGLQYFSKSLQLSCVNDLDFASNRFSEIGIANLALAFDRMQMTRIVLDNNVVTDQGLRDISRGIIPSLRTLRVLSLANTNIHNIDSLFTILPNVTQIAELNLQSNKLDEANYMHALQRLPSINVTALQLRDTKISSQVMRVLTQSIQLSGVRKLDISDNPIGDNNLLEFFKKFIFEPFDMLLASTDVIPNYEMRYIHFANSATNLQSLCLDDVNVTTSSALGLCRILPSTNIQMSSSSMVDNYIDPSKVDIRSCYTSSASHLSLPWFFSTAELAIQRLPKIDMRCAIKDSVITCEGSMLYANGDRGFFKFSTQLLKTTAGIDVMMLIECLGALAFAFRSEIGQYLSSYIPRPVVSAYRYYEDNKQCKIINVGIEIVIRSKTSPIASVVHDVAFFSRSAICKNEKTESVISKVGGALLTIGASYGAVRLVGYLTGNALIGYALAPIITKAPRICQSVARSYQKHGFFSALGTAVHEVVLAIPGGEYIDDSLKNA